jgi:large subunit ribosomal protein L25
VSSRPVVVAESREITGKKVAVLRRRGILPAVVYGHAHASQAIQLDAHEFDVLRRKVGRHALLDLKVGGGRATPVLLQHVHVHPATRHPMHADFLAVRLGEEMTVDVPVAIVGEAPAVARLGGTLLHLREGVQVRALPADLPSVLELDVSSLEDFEAVLHVRDLVLPSRVTLVTDPDEPLARVQPPRVEVEPVAAAEAAEAAPAEAEEGAPAASAEPGAEGAAEEA